MATAAVTPLASSVEKTNGAKLNRLLIDGGTTVLRKAFDRYHPPAGLATDLNTYKPLLMNLFRKKVLRKPQWEKLFPPTGASPDSSKFDITLLFVLLTNICGLTPPGLDWYTNPAPSDTSFEANLARVRFYRNELYGHVTTTGVDSLSFASLWAEISRVLVSLGLAKAEVDRLKSEKCSEQYYIDVLIEWAESEEAIKSDLKKIHQSENRLQQAVDDVRQTQVKTHKTMEDMYQNQANTQQSIEGVCKTVAEVLRTQIENQQTLEEVRQTQTKNEQELKKVAAGFQELNTKVDSIKEEGGKDRNDEVLQNLAKSEFRGDIEYYVERFQTGTREWVFDRVQKWLDDRGSQNRVMVISGNAGMGKSVIAAVICKRMQEAGRLTGSHFCKYNNVRYCKPQLMLHSLAFHLSTALPEYKQALVKQLSRNLGANLNNMSVEELFALLFKEPLSAVGDPGRNMLIVIDGLDESEYHGRNDLLNVISRQFCLLPNWIRFLVTTRPATNIAEKLKHLKPFELKHDDQKNLEDIRVLFTKKLQDMLKPVEEEEESELLEKLVLKSEGLMLYAGFLVLFINENASALHQKDLDGSLPLGISSVYDFYFSRLQDELTRIEELDIKEEHFLNLLSAITASREPLPVGFVSKVLVPGINSPLARRKVLKALASVSALLPICDERLHVIHKSVKDWLTDTSCYGEHEFIVEEKYGHQILEELCIDELVGLKRKGAGNAQLSATEKYALYHGARHMLHSGVDIEPLKVDELTKAYVIDLEILYAKILMNGSVAAEDLLWLEKTGISAILSEESKSILDTLLFLLRKFLNRFTDAPRTFLQTILNEGGKVLSFKASNLLQNGYPGIPYMENLHKEPQQGGVEARFECSACVVCLDVSPKLEYMVCECSDGMLQLWSLHTGRRMWTRPVKEKRCFKRDYEHEAFRKLPSVDVASFFRSVVFHPIKHIVLPGILSHAYGLEGELKPLFPKSGCRFSVCSISGDKSKIVTDCPQNSKCLFLWSLKDGSEIDRISRDEDILSFAWSRDGRLLAISHSSGLICLVDVMHDFIELAQTTTTKVCGILKFSPDHQSLFCWHWYKFFNQQVYRLDVDMDSVRNTYSLNVVENVSYDYQSFESFDDCGFLLGDIVVSKQTGSMLFVLGEQSLLRCLGRVIEMVNILNANKRVRCVASKIALSLDGRTVYVSSCGTVTAWDLVSGNPQAEKNLEITWPKIFIPLKEGILITTGPKIFELWDYKLSDCIKRWTGLSDFEQVIPISEELIALVFEFEVKVLNTSSGEFISSIQVSHRRVITCSSKFELLTEICGSLQLFDGTTVVWQKDWSTDRGVFSPKGELLVVLTSQGPLVLDSVSGKGLCILPTSAMDILCQFVSDEECVSVNHGIESSTVQLFNVRSGDLLSSMEVESRITCLAASSKNGLFAIGLLDCKPNFKVIKVHLPRRTVGGTTGELLVNVTIFKAFFLVL